MLRFLTVVGFILSCLLLTACTEKYALPQVYPQPQVAVETPAPHVKEAVAIPLGSDKCVLAPTGYYRGVWLTSHRVCHYSNNASGKVWIQGYWSCTEQTANKSICKNWQWRSARWTDADVLF